MTIDAAAATRKFIVVGINHDLYLFPSSVLTDGRGHIDETLSVAGPFGSEEEAQAACDLANLRAVLSMIREPSDKARLAGFRSYADQDDGCENPIDIWRAMIDAKIEETNNAYEQRIDEPETQVAAGTARDERLREICEEFMRRVDAGEIHSTRTYAKMKAALAAKEQSNE